jgi:transcription antitermination factor NusG
MFVFLLKNTMKSWYAIYVRSRTEKKVAAGLQEAGIEHFLPLQRTLRRWSDRKKWVDMPLIPGYCFINVSENHLLSIVQMQNIVAIVKFNGKPAVIPEMQIEFLKRLLSQNEVAYRLAVEIPKPGQKVEIIAGPFIGLFAEMQKIKHKSKIFLRLEHIMNVYILEIPLEHVIIAIDQSLILEL